MIEMATQREREVITEFLEFYSNCPCLWDIGSDQYKDRDRKTEAWECLAEKLREIEPDANVVNAKKKIQHMRTAYKREEKKIEESKKAGAKKLHVPILWYFNLLSPVFNNSKDEESKTGVDTIFASDEDTKPCQTEKNSGAIKKNTYRRELKRKKLKLIKTAHALVKRSEKKLNTFGVYVGEQLEQIDKLQRQVAEKLISEVLFLAKTRNLRFDSKIETPSRTDRSMNMSRNSSRSQSPSPQLIVPSELSQYSESSVSLQDNPVGSTPSPRYIRLSISPQRSNTSSPPSTSQVATTKRDKNPNDTSLYSSTLNEKNNRKNHIIKGNVRTALAKSKPSLYTVSTKENQNQISRIIVHDGPANSLLADLLMDKN